MQMDAMELQNKVLAMEKELQRLKDIEDIRRLQHIYGFYLTSFMNEEMIDLFSDSPESTLDFPEGTFFAKKGVRLAFGHTNKEMNPEFMHQLMQLQGVIDVAEDGKTAKGRWWGFGAMANPETERNKEGVVDKGVTQSMVCGVYENEYIKEEGSWKFWKIKWVPLYSFAPEKGWVKPERLAKKEFLTDGQVKFPNWWNPDLPGKGINYEYPSGYIMPFHYKHPVTGKESTEEQRNASVKGLKN
jgi:hypothetical protein